jgi:hypothetical protein
MESAANIMQLLEVLVMEEIVRTRKGIKMGERRHWIKL